LQYATLCGGTHDAFGRKVIPNGAAHEAPKPTHCETAAATAFAISSVVISQKNLGERNQKLHTFCLSGLYAACIRGCGTSVLANKITQAQIQWGGMYWPTQVWTVPIK